MNVPKISSKTSLFLLLLVISTLTIIPYLGLTNFHTKGEPREAIVAVSMLQNDNWILPINNGGDIAYKPPFFHWCIAALSLPAGEVTEFTSRLPSALAAIIMAIACFLFFAKRSRNDIAFLASLLLLSGFEVHRAAMASSRYGTDLLHRLSHAPIISMVGTRVERNPHLGNTIYEYSHAH